jgi:two-component system cell cycle response regulator
MPEDFGTIITSDRNYSDTDFEKKIPSLTLMTGDHIGRRILLADDRITLGRSPQATILLHDTHVSRLHLAIAFDPEAGAYRLRDLGSSNGTLLNGKRISEATLKESDKIIIGTTMLRFGWADKLDLQYHTEIDQLMNIDELTGLVVKRRFDEEMNRSIAVARAQGADLAMIMIDIDGLKQINDTYGHAFGAYTIAQTGRLIKAEIDRKGLASRFGGDEFMAFLPNRGIEDAHRIAEEIRACVETYSYEKDGVMLRPTISIGVSALKPDDSMASIFDRADEALYSSKKAGRNKVSVSY